MKIDFPRYSERVGAVSIHGIQRIYEIDSGKSKGFHSSHRTVRKFDYDEISNILHSLAIVIPIKNEKLKLLEGVLCGIPNECLVIIVSNSTRNPIDRFAMEAESIRQLVRFMDKRIIIVHQQDLGLADVFKRLGYNSILDKEGIIRAGKAEGMIIGMLIAKMYNKDYVGFIDGDNYVPGAVNEYVKIYAAGFGLSNTPYSNVRLSWVFKPKVKNNSLQFSKWGRVSEVTNKSLNGLLASLTGFETDIIKTGNAGEHALSMPLAERLHYSTGYSIETKEFVNIFEKFGGLLPSEYPEVMEKGIEIFQIETRNPHFHEDKGAAHLNEMLEASLNSIQESKLCQEELKKNILEQIKQLSKNKRSSPAGKQQQQQHIIEPINTIDISEFENGLREKGVTFLRYGGVR